MDLPALSEFPQCVCQGVGLHGFGQFSLNQLPFQGFGLGHGEDAEYGLLCGGEGDGCFIAFVSDASNLVPADTNGFGDVFLHDRQLGNIPLPFSLALALDGVDDYATAPDSASLDLGTAEADDFTIETFFYVPDLTNATTDTLIWKNGAYGLYIIFSNSGADRLIFRIWTGPSSYIYGSYDVDLSVGWHHVAGVFDNEFTASQDLVALYLDGTLAASSTAFEFTPGIPNSASALNVGAYLGVNPYAGWMEETRLSAAVRYSGASYTVPSAPFADDANTRALWHFNEVAGSTVFADDSGNGNTLTGVNGAQTGSLPTPNCDPGVDTDGDGFDDDVECYLVTDPLDACPDGPTDDAWPLDVSKNGQISVVADVLNFRGRIGATPGAPNWWQRLDFNADGQISVVGDVLKYRGMIGETCT